MTQATIGSPADSMTANPVSWSPGWRPLLLGLFLALGAFLLYAPTGGYDFVSFDDPVYVADNETVQRGLGEGSLSYAFTETGMSDWYPLLYLSYMLDVSLFGADNPAAHHLVNAFLHAANVLLLFTLLARWTTAPGLSAVVAALFAFHPLHVESVAWISARKDVLSTLFWLLAMLAYGAYAARRDRGRRCWIWYGVVTLCLVAGCLTKAMVVTLPLALLLVDIWPLGRHRKLGAGVPGRRQAVLRLGIEKLPWLAISLAVGVLHLKITGEQVDNLPEISLLERGAVAVVSQVHYLVKLVWPMDLAVWYPHPAELDPDFLTRPGFLGRLLASLLVLGGVTVFAWKQRRQRPYLGVGWLWFLVTMAPVSGIVSFASFHACDRYAYVPMWGIYWMLAWGGREWAAGKPKGLWRGALAAALVACLVLSWRQIRVWQGNETLFRQCLAATGDNSFAHNSLGYHLLNQGRAEEALGHFRQALAIRNHYHTARNNLATALQALGRPREAEAKLRIALAGGDDRARTHYHLGNALLAQGKLDQATVHFRRALELDPEHADARHNLGVAVHQSGQVVEAMAHYHAAIDLDPEHPDAHYNLANAHIALGRHDAAVAALRNSLVVNPQNANAHNNLGQLLQMRGNYGAALDCYREALRLDPDHPQAKTQREFILRNSSRKSPSSPR